MFFGESFVTYVRAKKRQKEFEQVSKMNPDNLADAIKKYHPSMISSWQGEAIDRLTDFANELIKVKLAESLKYERVKDIKENGSYAVTAYISGYEIWKMFSNPPSREEVEESFKKMKRCMVKK